MVSVRNLQASVELADELVSAARTRNALSTLSPNKAVLAYDQAYWAAMTNGSQEDYTSMYNGLGVIFFASIFLNGAPLVVTVLQ